MDSELSLNQWVILEIFPHDVLISFKVRNKGKIPRQGSLPLS